MRFETTDELRVFLDQCSEGSYEERKVFLRENLVLPSWVELPAPLPVFDLNVVSKDRVVVTPVGDDETEGLVFSDLVEAYDHVSEVLNGGAVFSGDVHLFTEKEEDPLRRFAVSVPLRNEAGVVGAYRLLMVHDEHWAEDALKFAYHQFLETVLEYWEDPSDFVNAWHFVNAHPVFWWRRNPESTYWETLGGVETVKVFPYREGEGVRFVLEGGEAVPPGRVEHYHDVRLDVEASSYEEGFVLFAAKVAEFFELDGNKREGVESEVSEWEKEIQARIDEYEEWKKN